MDEASFQKYVAPETTETLATGNNVITLEKPGKEWYICSVCTQALRTETEACHNCSSSK